MDVSVPYRSKPEARRIGNRRLLLFLFLSPIPLLTAIGVKAILGFPSSVAIEILLFLMLWTAARATFGPEKPSAGKMPQGDEMALQAQAWQEMADPALVFDQRGMLLACNRALEAILDLAPGELLGRELNEILGDRNGPKLHSQWLLDTLDVQGWARRFEISFSAAGRGAISLEGDATRLGDGDGKRYAMVMRDMTERSRRERALQRQERSLHERYASQTHELAQKVEALAQANEDLQETDQMRSELISLVSHQIRAPLTNMLGAVEGMQSGCPSPTSVCRRMFVVLRDQMARLSRLVDDVLNVTQLESGDAAIQAEPISLMSVLQQATEQVGARGHRTFQLPYMPVLPLVMADRDRLTEVLINLLDNADKYSPPGHDVRLEVRPTETEVTVSVLDQGPGLPPEDLDRIFEKFHRSDVGDAQRAYGYGLGLYVCRLLVEAQGGRIWATNRPEGGASLSFSIPVATA